MAQRIATGAVLVAMTTVLIYFGGLTLGIAMMVALLVAVHEEMKALRTAGHHIVAWPTYAVSAIGLFMILYLGDKTVLPLVMAASFAIVITVVFRKSAEPELSDVVMSIVPLFSVVLPCMGIMCVSRIVPVPLQRTLMSMIVIVPILGDTLAYFVGSKVGGPKLCPGVSPKKTVSGAIAGLVGSVLAAVLVGLIARSLCPEMVMEFSVEEELLVGTLVVTQSGLPSWGMIVLIGLLGGIAGQMGDLFASLVKRHAGIKDFSNLFPGHGGMLDRLDSIMFMALLIYSIRLLV